MFPFIRQHKSFFKHVLPLIRMTFQTKIISVTCNSIRFQRNSLRPLWMMSFFRPSCFYRSSDSMWTILTCRLFKRTACEEWTHFLGVTGLALFCSSRISLTYCLCSWPGPRRIDQLGSASFASYSFRRNSSYPSWCLSFTVWDLMNKCSSKCK